MARKPKAKKEAAAEAPRNLLAEAVNARTTNAPLMASKAEMQALLTDQRGPLVEFNETIAQGDKIAFRATELGVQVNSTPQNAPSAPSAPAWGVPPIATGNPHPIPASAPQVPPGAIARMFDTGIPVPAARRGGRGGGVHGFEHMEVGHSFFVAATEDNPNPAKRIASTVSSASTRLEPRKFVVRSVDETSAGRGKGARVWRTE